MLDADAKQRAWAAMEDAVSFRMVVAAEVPTVADGELAVWVCGAPELDEMSQAVGLVRKMARTFFGEKLTAVAPPPDGEGPFGLYVVATPGELDDAQIEDLSEEPPTP